MKPTFDEASARLDDYVRGKLDDDAADAFEGDLFARALAGEAPELAFREQLRRRFREMDARGTLSIWLDERGVERLMASGMRVKRFDFDPAHPTMPDFSTEFDILLTRVPIPLAGVRRLDAEIMSASGEVLKVMRDIDFDASENAVYACCERELAYHAAQAKTTTRVWAHDDRNERKLLLEIPL